MKVSGSKKDINNSSIKNHATYELKLYSSKLKLVGLCLSSGFIGGLFLWLGIDTQNIVLIIFGVLSLILIFALLRDIKDRRPVIKIDPLGITSLGWKWGTIPWEDIEAVKAINFHSTHSRLDTICIQLKNPEKYLTQMPSFDRKLRKADKLLGCEHLTLNIKGLNRNIQAVQSHIIFLKSTGKIMVALPDYKEKQYHNGPQN